MNKHKELDQLFFKPSKRYKNLLSVAVINNYTYISQAILDLYYNKKKTGLEIAQTFNTPKNPSWVYKFITASGLIVRPQGPVKKAILPDDSYQQIDDKINYRHFAEKRKVTISLGYKFVSEAITSMYYAEGLPANIIAETFKCTGPSITIILQRINKSSFESSNFFSVLTKKQKTEILKKIIKQKIYSWKEIRDLLHKNNMIAAPKLIKALLARRQRPLNGGF